MITTILKCAFTYNSNVYKCEIENHNNLQFDGNYDDYLQQFVVTKHKQTSTKRFDVVVTNDTISFPFLNDIKWNYHVVYVPMDICYVCIKTKSEPPDLLYKEVISFVLGMILGRKKMEFRFTDVLSIASYQVCKNNMKRVSIPFKVSFIEAKLNEEDEEEEEINRTADIIPKTQIKEFVETVNYILKIQKLDNINEIIRYFDCLVKVIDYANVLKQKLEQLNMNSLTIVKNIELIDHMLEELRIGIGKLRTSHNELVQGLIEKTKKFNIYLKKEIEKCTKFNTVKNIWNLHDEKYGMKLVHSQLRDFTTFIKGQSSLKNGEIILNSPSIVNEIHEYLKNLTNKILHCNYSSLSLKNPYVIFIQHLSSVTDSKVLIESFEEIDMYVKLPHICDSNNVIIEYIMDRIFIIHKDPVSGTFIPLASEQYITTMDILDDSHSIKNYRITLDPSIYMSMISSINNQDDHCDFKVVKNDRGVNGFYGYIYQTIDPSMDIYIPKLLTLPANIMKLSNMKRETDDDDKLLIPYLTNNPNPSCELQSGLVRLQEFFQPDVLSTNIIEYVKDPEVFLDLFEIPYDINELKIIRLQSLVQKIAKGEKIDYYLSYPKIKNSSKYETLLAKLLMSIEELRKTF